MSEISAPHTHPTRLLELVQAAHSGKLVVPDFQRPFVWPKDAIEELLVSLLQGYFVGTLLVLETPSHDPLFPYRPIDGLAELGVKSGDHGVLQLLLDGQQRLTSLFYAVHQPPIPIKGTTHPYRFYVMLEAALTGDIESAVVGISTGWGSGTKQMEEAVAQRKAVPISLLASDAQFFPWLYTPGAFPDETRDALIALRRRLADFVIPVVSLLPDVGAENIVNIFERVNRTGVSLSLFDLVAARLYVRGLDSPTLHDLWASLEHDQPSLAKEINGEAVLRVVALVQGLDLKRSTLLNLDQLGAEAFVASWREAVESLVKAWTRLDEVYGAKDRRLIPYSSMLVPLAAILHDLERDHMPAYAYARVDRWYWRSAFGQRYESTVNTRSEIDAREIVSWCKGQPAPAWIDDLRVDEISLDVEAPRSAIYRGVLCLVALRGAKDFCTGNTMSLHECDDDHVFPKAAFSGAHPVNGVLNRAFIESHCNKRKSDRPPSDFFVECLTGHGENTAALLDTLETQMISEDGYRALLADDFAGFVRAREVEVRAAIAERIGAPSASADAQ